MSKKQKVYQYDGEGNFIQEYESCTKANFATGGNKDNRSKISRACKRGWKCRGFYWSYQKSEKLLKYQNQVTPPGTFTLPNILIFDIETSLIKCYTFGIWDVNIAHDNIIQDWFILGYSAKWLFDSEVMAEFVTHEEAIEADDKRVVEKLWTLLDKADIVIAHNGDKFDIKKTNTRFFYYNMVKPSPYQSIDTLKTTKAVFAHTSNKLDYLVKFHLDKCKDETSMKLWRDCMCGCPDSLAYMEKYCIKDSLILEEFYLKLRGWIKNHPNLGIHIDDDGIIKCNHCLHQVFQSAGYYVTSVNKYKSIRCLNCGGLAHLRKSEITVNQKAQILASNAR